jgi:iron complex transport system substrate-binding protein
MGFVRKALRPKAAGKAASPIVAALLAFMMALSLVACSSPSKEVTEAKPDDTGGADSTQEVTETPAFPMTLENYAIPEQGGVWEPYEVTFEQAPQRIVANTQAAAEFLVKLGLGDRIVGVGALYGEPGSDVSVEFSAIPVLNQTYLTQEQVLGASPDLVFGRGDLFNETEYGVGSVEKLNQLGIRTYLMHSSRDGSTVDDLYRDIDETGVLFEVEDAAKVFAEELQSRVKTLEEHYKNTSEKTYCILVPNAEGAYSIFAGPRMSVQEQLLATLNLRSVATDVMMTVSNEQLVDLNPDVILILAYTGIDTNTVIEGLTSHPALETVGAIQNGALYPLDFGKATYSFRIVDEVERIAPLVHTGD